MIPRWLEWLVPDDDHDDWLEPDRDEEDTPCEACGTAHADKAP